ncbi:hypothetical protein C8J56DRAFT_888192 [Mycena floridula]|nr:hypothetical protein C8J56DRAFT_888192 [Mycena floridula]
MHDLRFVLAGRKDPATSVISSGCYREMPWTRNGRRKVPFPIALECGTGQQAFEAKKVLQLLAEDCNNKQDLSVFLQALPHNVQLKELAISMERTSGYFIVVLLGQIGGIYLSRRRAASSLSKSSAAVFRDVVLYSSFIDALQGMMTFGDHLPGQFYRGRSLPDGLRSGHLIVGIRSAAVEKSSEICIDASEVSFIGLSYNADAKSAIVNSEPYHQSPDLAYAVKFLASLVSDCLVIFSLSGGQNTSEYLRHYSYGTNMGHRKPWKRWPRSTALQMALEPGHLMSTMTHMGHWKPWKEAGRYSAVFPNRNQIIALIFYAPQRFTFSTALYPSPFMSSQSSQPSKESLQRTRDHLKRQIDELAAMFAMARPRDIGVPPSQRNDKDLTAVDWHDYRSVLCMGKGQHIGNISRWLSACWNHRPGHFCDRFGGFLTPRLDPDLLSVLEKLVVQYEATGCAWGEEFLSEAERLRIINSTLVYRPSDFLSPEVKRVAAAADKKRQVIRSQPGIYVIQAGAGLSHPSAMSRSQRLKDSARRVKEREEAAVRAKEAAEAREAKEAEEKRIWKAEYDARMTRYLEGQRAEARRIRQAATAAEKHTVIDLSELGNDSDVDLDKLTDAQGIIDVSNL